MTSPPVLLDTPEKIVGKLLQTQVSSLMLFVYDIICIHYELMIHRHQQLSLKYKHNNMSF